MVCLVCGALNWEGERPSSRGSWVNSGPAMQVIGLESRGRMPGLDPETGPVLALNLIQTQIIGMDLDAGV